MKGDGTGSDAIFGVEIWFDPDFDPFIPASARGRVLRRHSGHSTTLKDLVEACGIPHTEVGQIVLNGDGSASFSTRISDGDRVEVLPVLPAGQGGSPLQPAPATGGRFAADIHLGKAARRLRLLGFDTVWFTGRDDRELIDIVESEGRILLTRDRRLLMNNRVVYGCCIRSDQLLDQVRQVVVRYGLEKLARPFSRSPACNGLLEERRKEMVNALLPEKTRRYYEEFRACPSCGRIYWQGAHARRLHAFVDAVLR